MPDKAVSLIKSSAEIGTRPWSSNLSGCAGLKYGVLAHKGVGRVGKGPGLKEQARPIVKL